VGRKEKEEREEERMKSGRTRGQKTFTPMCGVSVARDITPMRAISAVRRFTHTCGLPLTSHYWI
jgi:hypothetical protein